MSEDIDIQNYMTGVSDLAAVDQSDNSTNSYQEAIGDSQPFTNEPTQTEPSPAEQNFKALSDVVEKLKAERDLEKREMQLQIDIMKANINRPTQREPEKPMFDGLEDKDIPNVGELRREWDRKEYAYKEQLEELQVAQAHPDYAEVLGQHLGPLIQQKPHLHKAIQAADNKALLAYELGKMQQELNNYKASVPSRDAQRMVDNSRKPSTLASVGGQSVLSKADYFANMSDKDFFAYATKHLEQI